MRLTLRGIDSLGRAAAIFDGLRAGWAASLGTGRLQELESDLRALAPADGFRLDAAGWFGS